MIFLQREGKTYVLIITKTGPDFKRFRGEIFVILIFRLPHRCFWCKIAP